METPPNVTNNEESNKLTVTDALIFKATIKPFLCNFIID
jgi:hypothetical protein